VKSYAPAEFWRHYDRLPAQAQRLADRTFDFFKRDPLYPGLKLKRIKRDVWSVRVGDHYRAMAKKLPDGWMWFWIGTHEEYNQLVKRV
jgi:hypothetical protein